MSAMLEINNICHSYGKTAIIKSLSFKLSKGSIGCLLGPSGCGKSTTLHMIAGLEEMTEGNIYIGDKRVNDKSPRDRDIAMVFQDLPYTHT